MNISEISRSLDAFNVKVHIDRSTDSYRSDDHRWSVNLVKENGDQRIEVHTLGTSFESTLTRAYSKFMALANSGMELMALPAPEPIDDEIPF